MSSSLRCEKIKIKHKTNLVELQVLVKTFRIWNISGDTVVTPLFFNWPEDHVTHDIDEQFMWGDGFMIVPALHEDNFVQFYLPPGNFFMITMAKNIILREIRKKVYFPDWLRACLVTAGARLLDETDPA